MKVASLTKIMIVAFIIVGVANVAAISRYESSHSALMEASQLQAAYKQLGIDLIGASDLLSEQARRYAQSGEREYYDAYMNEVNETKTRERVIEELIALGAPQNEIELAAEAAARSTALERLEMEAFEAVRNQNLDEAQRIMFGERYAEGKQAIIDVMNQYQREVDQRIKDEAKTMLETSEASLAVRIILNVVLTLSIIVSLMVILRYISRDQRLRAEHESRQRTLETELREAAVTAHEALSRLSAIYSSIPDTLFCKDISGVYTSCNRSFELQAGLTEREIVGKTYFEVFRERVPETVELYRNIDQKIVEERITSIVEETVTYPDGSRRLLETLKAPLVQDDKVVGLLGIGRDITQYREVKDRLERIINTAQVAFLLSVDGVLAEANEYSKTYLGAKAGNPAASVYAEAAQREALIRMAEENDTAVDTVKLKLTDGAVHRFLVTISSVEYEKKNAHILWGIDIEQDEIKNDQIRMMQQNLQLLLDALPIPVRIVDLETDQIVYVNNGFLELFEYRSPDEVCGQRPRNLLPESARSGATPGRWADMEDDPEKLISFEVVYQTKSGRGIETLLSTRRMEYRGRPSSIGIIKDLTAEKKHARMLLNAAEREKEANQAKSLFLANMSHEIRTPMNGIIGFSELALDDNISVGEKNEYLRKIKGSGEGLLQIIDDILDISKIEAGKVELEIIPFSLHEVFRICQAIILPKAKEKGITLYCYAEPSVGKMLMGDPTRLRQILLNLLSNAVKFTNVGTVKLLSSIKNATADSVTMEFEVKDSGIGMAPEQIDRIFDAFTQADATTTRKYGGTGLGLSITKNIVELMGGTLAVKSELGIGSKFSFALTFKTTDIMEGVEKQRATVNELKKPAFQGEVLLFEDNITNQEVVRDHLARVGLKTVIAENGEIGVDIVRKRMQAGAKPFDLIFMDIHMPVMDGLEAAQKLSEIGSPTPVVALTANVMTTSQEIYRAHGMPEYLAKPFKAQELWACLLKYFTPVSQKPLDVKAESEAEERQRIRVQTNFVKDNQTTYRDIVEALERQDIKLAHRLAHTLKGVAGLLGAKALVEAAQSVEHALSGGGAEPTPAQMDALGRELDATLRSLAPLLDQTAKAAPAGQYDKTAAAALLDRLEPLLAASNTECMDWVDSLKELPGAEDLIEQIEAFEFQRACETAKEIRKNL